MKFYFQYKSPDGLYGPAVTAVRMDEEGKMWIENGEYESQVNFCPFTGTPAEKKMEVSDTTRKGTKEYKNK